MTEAPRVSRDPLRGAYATGGDATSTIRRWIRGERILEFGASDRTVRALLDNGLSITSITSDAEQLDRARQRLGGYAAMDSRLRLELVQTAEWPFDDDAFDSIIVDDLIGHALVPQRLFGEMRRILRPGGSLIINLPYGLAPHGKHDDEIYIRALRTAMSETFHVTDAHLVDGRLLAVAEEGTAVEEPHDAFLAIAETALRQVEQELRRERARGDQYERRWNKLLAHPVVRLARGIRDPLRAFRSRRRV